jgi:hypothetical protein
MTGSGGFADRASRPSFIQPMRRSFIHGLPATIDDRGNYHKGSRLRPPTGQWRKASQNLA